MKLIGFCVLAVLSFCVGEDSVGFSQRYRKPHHQRLWCLNNQFTCNPNQCVDNSVLCDGVNDCEDGSDENSELCKSLKSCVLPKQTDDKSYVVNCEEHSLSKPGEYVSELSLLSFACNPGYARDYGGSHFQSFCQNSTWIPPIPCCNKMCTKLENPHLKYSCFYNDKEIECNDAYAFGTKLHLSCSLPYHRPSHDEVVCNDDGHWSIKDVKCVPECGKYSDEAEHFLKGNDLPWHVIVKRKNDDGTVYVFSGTLIAPNLVLTVARSVADLHDKKLPPEDFVVVVNNYLDHTYQRDYKVKDIFFAPNGFFSKEDIAQESDDIAILYLTKKVEIDATVLPVCVDWTGLKLLPGALPSAGKMVRIGDNYSFENPSQNEIYTLPFEAYDHKTCLLKIPNSVLEYDQFCGNVTDHKTTGNSDWGTGYYVENPKEHLYYIKGIYRVTYGDEGIKVFTDVPTHIEWISDIHQKIEALDDSETSSNQDKEDIIDERSNLDEHDLKKVNHSDHPPLHYGALELSCHAGEYSMKFTHGCYLPYKNGSNFHYEVKCPFNPQNDLESYCKRTVERASVPEYSTLSAHCNCGHAVLSKKMEKSVCFNGQWLPEPEPCKKTCRKLKPEGLLLKCTYEGKPIECYGNMIHGTYVASECLPGYAPEFPVKPKDLFCDEEGEWTGSLHRCIPVCGHAMVKNSNTSIDVRFSHHEEFPWHVAIYDKTKDHELVCSGSIITENTILTAAHCFYDSNDNKKNVSDFVIAVGKISRDFKIKDTPKTQFYDIDSLFMKNYYGEVWKYFNDLAIIKTKSKISFSPEVFPICMQLDKLLPSGHILQTAGWGSQDEGKFSSVLKISDLPYISLTECIQKAPLSAKQYILEDKSCLGRHNESMENFANSGSGIFYYDKNSSTYHIFGVANMKIHDYPFITVFTNTNYHALWIRSTHSAIMKLKQ